MLNNQLINQKVDNWVNNFMKLYDYEANDDNLEDLVSIGLINPNNIELYPDIQSEFAANPNRVPKALQEVLSVGELVSICLQQGVTDLTELTDIVVLFTVYDMAINPVERIIDGESLIFARYLDDSLARRRHTVFSIGRVLWKDNNLSAQPQTATFSLQASLQKAIVEGKYQKLPRNEQFKRISVNVDENVDDDHVRQRLHLIDDYMSHRSDNVRLIWFDANLNRLPIKVSSMIINQLPKFRQALQNPNFANALHGCVNEVLKAEDNYNNSVNAEDHFHWALAQGFVKDIVKNAPNYYLAQNNHISLFEYLQKLF